MNECADAEAVDVHFPYLTVLQTLGFAVRTETPSLKTGHRAQRINDVTDALLNVFGLQAARNTLLGNEFITGVS